VIIVNDGTAARTVTLAVPGVANGTTVSDALTGASYTVSKGTLSLPTQAHGLSILVTAPPAG
jgi:hypothetical protein